MSSAADIPNDRDALASALIEQREYTLGIYADLPDEYWLPAQFPYRNTVNPPLWELGHIAYFAEYFCTRWRADDPECRQTRSLMDGADALLHSGRIPHRERWQRNYPSKEQMFAYMQASLERVLSALAQADTDTLSLFQLALLHEDMHAEALLMTRNTLGLSLHIGPTPLSSSKKAAFTFAAQSFVLGVTDRSYQFDNELPPHSVWVEDFDIDAQPVSALEFAQWRGNSLGEKASDSAALHVSFHEAESFARDHGRRLPSEAEWELAATQSEAFRQSTGDVWEWTASSFQPRPSFVPGPYHDYSVPWFSDAGTVHMVLKGGSFATHERLKYPQYRNFYVPERSDMFCGFRTCSV